MELSGGRGAGDGCSGVEEKRELTVSKCPKPGRPKRAGGNLIYLAYIHIAFCTLTPQDAGISFLSTHIGNSSNLFVFMATKIISCLVQEDFKPYKREAGEMRD